MAPSAHRDGQIIGFVKGFKLEKNDYLDDFQKSTWNEYDHEREQNKKEFQIAYIEEYEKGKAQRLNIQKKFQSFFGNQKSEEISIRNKYLNQITEIFYGISYLFKSWEERVEKEVFPINETAKSIEEIKVLILNLIKNEKYQKSLTHLKVLFLKEKDSKLYHETLSIDSSLQRLRSDRKQNKISKEDYQIGLLKVKNQLSFLKNKI